MSKQTIPPGGKEPVSWFALDGSDPPVAVTGATDLFCEIRRMSDQFVYDWDDDTFKNGGWTTSGVALKEVDSIGFYRLNETNHDEGFDTSAITNPVSGGEDTYVIRLFENSGNDIANLPAMGEIITRRITNQDIADDAITASGLSTTAVEEIRDGILSDSVPFNGADISAQSGYHTTTQGLIIALNNLSSSDVEVAVQAGLDAQGFTSVVASSISLSEKLLRNRIVIDESASTMILYDDDDSVLLTFNLTDKNGVAIDIPAGIPYNRTRGV